MGESPTVEPARPLVGRRVRWCGPAQQGYLTPAYRAALAAGHDRPPQPDEQLVLRPCEVGTITDLIATTRVGDQVSIRFDSGYELDTIVPTGLIEFV